MTTEKLQKILDSAKRTSEAGYTALSNALVESLKREKVQEVLTDAQKAELDQLEVN